jgi:hypothetical protein
MKDLLLMLSSVMPEEMHIEQLEKALAEYKIDPSKDNRSKLALHCMMFTAKEAADATPGGVEEMMRKSDQLQQGYELLNPKKN